MLTYALLLALARLGLRVGMVWSVSVVQRAGRFEWRIELVSLTSESSENSASSDESDPPSLSSPSLSSSWSSETACFLDFLAGAFFLGGAFSLTGAFFLGAA